MGILSAIERPIRSAFLRMLAGAGGSTDQGDLPRNPERILVIRVDRIGDAVVSTPALKLLRSTYPESRIDILLGEKNRRIGPLLPVVDEVLVWERHPVRLLRTVRRLRTARYDLVLNLHTDRSSNAELSSALARGTRIVRASELPGAGDGHIVEAIDRTLESLGIHVAPRTESETRLSLRLPSPPRFDPEGPVGINLSSRDPERQWPTDSYRTLVRELASRGYRITLLAEPGDRERAAGILPDNEGVTLEVRDSLADYLELLTSCSVVITPDSGVVHMAAALGIPVVGLYATEEKETRWRPWGVPFQTLTGRGSIASITADEVAGRLDRLKRNRSGDYTESGT